eukprot:CAMPEP_0118931194 /NCGR_PEP_ID=MMETSP1169-20130426/7616_1 /TAXON_ID=36882 /ORGANISM="Pyramimonas obovata, Strain CCMP722" /LENGTH=401 /DNA_ID=CAMNT_0006873661 /DNA_START=105 /DNA_END=1310 /DNA_ORIENTATION=-
MAPKTSVTLHNHTPKAVVISQPGKFSSGKQRVEAASVGFFPLKSWSSFFSRVLGIHRPYLLLKVEPDSQKGLQRKTGEENEPLRVECDSRLVDIVQSTEHVVEVVKNISDDGTVNIVAAIYEAKNVSLCDSSRAFSSVFLENQLATLSESSISESSAQSVRDMITSLRSDGDSSPSRACSSSGAELPIRRTMSTPDVSTTMGSKEWDSLKQRSSSLGSTSGPMSPDRRRRTTSKSSVGSAAYEFSGLRPSMTRSASHDPSNKILHRDDLLDQLGAGLGGSSPFVTTEHRADTHRTGIAPDARRNWKSSWPSRTAQRRPSNPVCFGPRPSERLSDLTPNPTDKLRPIGKIMHRDELLQHIGSGLGGSNPFLTPGKSTYATVKDGHAQPAFKIGLRGGIYNTQ